MQDQVRQREGQIIGSAGPTTNSHVDKYTPEMLDKELKAWCWRSPGCRGHEEKWCSILCSGKVDRCITF